jgi:hypothetical protein
VNAPGFGLRASGATSKAPIYLCLGMTKAASTLAYQLTEEVLRAAGARPMVLPRRLQRLSATINYFDRVDEALIQTVRRAAGSRAVVIKSHQRPDAAVVNMIRCGELPASYAIRDPRELALSMVDHGARSRRRGLHEFSEFYRVEDCLPSIDYQIESYNMLRDCPNLLTLPYNETCFATEQSVARIAEQLNVQVDAAGIARRFAGGRMARMFNRGQPLRYRELDAEANAMLLSRYGGFYARTDLADGHALVAPSHNETRRPSRLSEEVLYLRHWFRSRLGVGI